VWVWADDVGVRRVRLYGCGGSVSSWHGNDVAGFMVGVTFIGDGVGGILLDLFELVLVLVLIVRGGVLRHVVFLEG
ncbi:peptidase, partial [Burkholderia pseudomallei]